MVEQIDVRDFDAEVQEQEGDPIQFKLGGVVFRCIQPLPLGRVLVMTKNALNNPEDLESQAQQVNLLWQFVEPEQHQDLDRAIANLTDPSIIQKILEYLITSGTGRPTRGS